MSNTLAPLYLTQRIRELERQHAASGLMEKAGLAAAELARELIGNGTRILVLAGPGNNGGDALVAARWLKNWWYDVCVVFTGERSKLPPDAAAAFDAWQAAGGVIATGIPDPCFNLVHFDLVIDGLFGIGLTRPLDGRYPELIAQINALTAPILALDVPSGLDADTGRMLGAAVRARHTITFLGLKPGLFTQDGPDHAGEVRLADLGVIASSADGWLIDTPPALPPPRRKNSHKGSFGSGGVLGGAETMVGAALLAARAALLMGSGRVYAGLLAQHAPAVDMLQPELMLRDASNLLDLDGLDVLIAGPGLGRSPAARSLLDRALRHPAALVLDADALNLLASGPELRASLNQRRPGLTVITPHPGEAATLLATDTPSIQSDRIAAALELAKTYSAITVLKGCGSIVATPRGRWFFNASGNPGMAGAGMGDTLAGIIGGLIAQHMDVETATLLGVYLHGVAADNLVTAGCGPLGLTASEVALSARDQLNEWINES
ncbi:MAG TPA: NAD(P)H-hydrate dehydratase [Novimethylophilus sp.]|uniref:NAD(P)H-hydrate dehydratase n=1 Tax=Novimethylophilus sp. TaxID=2137426 RepID=UPI002F419069